MSNKTTTHLLSGSLSRPGAFRHSRSVKKQRLRTNAAEAATHLASHSYPTHDDTATSRQLRELIPPSTPVGEATRLLGGLLVKCLDSGNLRAAQELMRHELFNSATLQAMVLHARRDTEATLTTQINNLHNQIAEMESGHEVLHADFLALRTVIRERLDQAKRKAQGRIKPAQAARIEAASHTKIVSEFNRLRRNGDSYQSRTICSELAARFGVTADHVRKLRKSWLAGLKPMKRD